jgi:hypothetical protein
LYPSSAHTVQSFLIFEERILCHTSFILRVAVLVSTFLFVLKEEDIVMRFNVDLSGDFNTEDVRDLYHHDGNEKQIFYNL